MEPATGPRGIWNSCSARFVRLAALWARWACLDTLGRTAPPSMTRIWERSSSTLAPLRAGENTSPSSTAARLALRCVA